MSLPTILNSRRSVFLAFLPLLAIVAVGVWLRCRSLDESLWLDELHTSWVVAGELSDVAPRARLGNQHPLYFYAPLASTRLLGESEAALRAPSLFAGTLLILGAFFFTRFLTKQPLPALVAAWCVAVDFDSVWYSQEARVYALVQVVALAQLASLWRVAHSPGIGSRMLCVALSALLFYLHYTTALFLIAVAIILITAKVIAKERLAYRWKQMAIDAGAVALLVAPCLWQLREIAAARGNWISVVPRKSPLEALALFPLAPLGAALLIVVATVALAFAFGRRQWLGSEAAARRSPGAKSFAVLVPLALYILVVVLAWVGMETFAAPLLLKRYLIAVAAMPALAIGLLLAVLPAPARVLAAAVVVALAAYGSAARPWATWDNARRHSEDWRAAVSAVANCGAIDETPLLLRSGFIEADERHDSPLAIEREYCLAPIRGLYRIEAAEAIPLGSAPPSDDVLRKVAGHRRAALLTRSSSNASAQAAAIVDSLNDHQPGWTVYEEYSFGRVHVFCLQRGMHPR
jgi:mannosyltransferase